MKEKLEEINRHISALSHTIKDTEKMMNTSDVCFLKEFPVSMERVQISQPDPQMPSGALICVPRYLGNLPFRVWKKMQDVVQNKGFSSGTHCWDVEVKQSSVWILGVTTASNQRKGQDFFNTGVWFVYRYKRPLRSGFRVEQDLDRVRVNLDYDGGTVSFSDPVTNTHLHTFTTTFTQTLTPFFYNYDDSFSLRILPVNNL
ncbi:E3 ubiquitin-protein ligase TRIM39 [Labeo rohita]|uniref:E3 ubiquitin-protein ligase TRIM39 n=1 Tax=Labeo rohita TaxID=84645 RepID=UPI0021E2B769|nr:E3 ubiquitin-protein ligase TRIM39 [Labeo rohita]